MITFNVDDQAQSVLRFTNGFKHIPGKTEVLKIYANLPVGYRDALISTYMGNLNSFVWKDVWVSLLVVN